MMNIRHASGKDADAIVKLTIRFASSFVIDETAWRTSFAEILAQGDAVLLVAEADGAVIGYLLGFDHPTLHANGRTACVDELAVDEAHQRKGAGRQLMRAFEGWGRERGCVLVSLATRRAGAFYAAIGYEESATYHRLLL